MNPDDSAFDDIALRAFLRFGSAIGVLEELELYPNLLDVVFDDSLLPPPYPDLVAFPGLHQKVYGDRGRARRKMPGCNGPISVRDREAVKIDIENLKAGVEAKEGKVEDLFISAASPGVVSLFFHNDY